MVLVKSVRVRVCVRVCVRARVRACVCNAFKLPLLAEPLPLPSLAHTIVYFVRCTRYVAYLRKPGQCITMPTPLYALHAQRTPYIRWLYVSHTGYRYRGQPNFHDDSSGSAGLGKASKL